MNVVLKIPSVLTTVLLRHVLNMSVYCMTTIYKEEFEDTKGVIRSRKSKDRKHNGQMKRNKRINNDLRNTLQKTKDRAIRTSLKPR